MSYTYRVWSSEWVRVARYLLHWTLPARHFYAVVRYQITGALSHVLPSGNFNTYLGFRGIRGWRNHCSTVSTVSTACSTVCRIISIVSPDTYTILIPDIFRRKGSRGHGPSLGGPGALDRASSGPFGTRDKTACRTKRGPLHNFRTLFQACSGPSQTWRGQFQPFKGPWSTNWALSGLGWALSG